MEPPAFMGDNILPSLDVMGDNIQVKDNELAPKSTSEEP